MASQTFEHRVQIYYEDTDHSGVVYHSNYLKYFERAREHMLGTAELRRLWEDEGVGFVVYKAELTYKLGAVFGDEVAIRSTVEVESAFRLVFKQNAVRAVDDVLLVQGSVQLVCVDRDKKLVKVPESVTRAVL
ncbi:MAG: YbgC/FadM family acyl-CoA thioesterase [Sandaracinus sp.]|nr:YbgC/FadM family acyl-CoA thioesterase [Myxococcales bacterium]MCB9602292.1 YbgC/FadM family acyl-CoA thioesterase [Sandaracinus sp.]